MFTRTNLNLAVYFSELALSVSVLGWSVLGLFTGKVEFDKVTGGLGSLFTSIHSVLGLLESTMKEREKQAKRRKGQGSAGSELAPAPKSFKLTPSFDSGRYGGLIGGALAGILIAASYYPTLQRDAARGLNAPWVILPLIVIFAVVTGNVLGAASQYAILRFRHFTREKHYPAFVFNELTGGVLGGVLGGIFIGALGGWMFGFQDPPPPDETLLVVSSVIGSVCIVLGALLYEYRGSWRNVVNAIIATIVVAPFAIMLGVVALDALNVFPRFFVVTNPSLSNVLVGGALIGIALGAVLGFLIGLALIVYRLQGGSAESV